MFMNYEYLKNRNTIFEQKTVSEKKIFVDNLLSVYSVDELRKYRIQLNETIQSEQVGFFTTQGKEFKRNPLTSEAICLHLEYEYIDDIITFIDESKFKLLNL